MALNVGSRLGPYSVTAQIGEGGMGQVYRARDTKLDRDVAIKILPEAFAHDAERLARFTREAKTLASLNHPNIAIIHGLEQAGDVHALVMELVEGDDLSQRIARGAIPIDEALPIAKQIAEALEAAHEQGIIHRDLKPANIKVRTDGTVKVLDFGLAKAMEPAGAMSPGMSQSPTITTPAMTQAGMILGTAAYMSPEQAKGRTVDKRSDVWAFGAVLYEMLTGQRAFAGSDVSEVLASLLAREPDWAVLPAGLSPTVLVFLRQCLQKDLKQRVGDIHDVRLALEGAFETATAPGAAPVAPDLRRRVATLTAGALVVAAATGATVWVATRPMLLPAPELHLDITTPPTTGFVSSIAISPDGRRVVFTADPDGDARLLWVRALDGAALQPLAGTDGASLPFWSPDGRSLGFFADNKLKRIDIAGGSVQVLADAPSARGGTWNRDGVILFAPTLGSSIYQVSDTGGQATVLTELDRPAQSDHRAPQFLPDGRHFLYYARGTAEGRGVYVGGLDGSHTPRLIDADAGAVYAATGHLLFVREGTLYAVRFDLERLTLTDTPFPVAQQAIIDGSISLAALSASEAGPIIYRAGATAQQQLVWIGRSGQEEDPVGEADSLLNFPELSPDGRRVVVGRNIGSNWDLWLIDTARGVRTRLTSDPATDLFAVWSPDSSQIAFLSTREGEGLYTKSLTGTAGEDALLENAGRPTDWSSDGQFLLYQDQTPTTGNDLWALPMAGDRTSFPVARSRFNEQGGRFSPDGKWIAYVSDESGRPEIYVQPFPGPGDKTQVSTTGVDIRSRSATGALPVRWRADGKELFYVADTRLMAVPTELLSTERTITIGPPVPLFASPGGLSGVARDGQRFLFLIDTTGEDTPPISVILNWAPAP